MMDPNWKILYHGDDCGCGCSCGCSHEEGGEDEAPVIVMVDQETGEEYQFEIVDEFFFEGEVYYVLGTLEEEPEFVFVKEVDGDEEEGPNLISLEPEEYERVQQAYFEACDEDEAEDGEESEN